MSVEREMSLAEWCAKLPSQHVVNRELATLTKQLAALAEQNEKFREALQKLACLGNGEQYGNSIGNCIAQEALSLPNLVSPVLNKYRAEGMREAINLYSPDDSAQDWIDKIIARADELEKTND